MPISQVQLTDTFDQWRQKTNQMVDKVNTLGASGDVLSVSSPTTGQILVYDGTFFRNVPVTGDVTLASNGAMTVLNGGGNSSKGRIYFSGWNQGLF